jgi:hypothetical protein
MYAHAIVRIDAEPVRPFKDTAGISVDDIDIEGRHLERQLHRLPAAIALSAAVQGEKQSCRP